MMGSTKTAIESQIREISDMLMTAKWSYEIWWVLVGPDRPRYVDRMNNYPGFFRPSIDAHYHTLIISCFKLYDRGKRTINFNRLMKLARRHWPKSNHELAEIEQTYEQALALWEKVKIIRHEFYAHQAFDVDVADMYNRAKIKPDQFKELVDLSTQILNRIYHAFSRTTIAVFMISSSDDTHRLLERLSDDVSR